MAIQVYLNFAGNCREAVLFYADVFGTEQPKMMTFGETPQSPEYPLPEEAKSLIMHTRLKLDDTTVMFSDTFPGMPYTLGNQISLAVVNPDIDRIRYLFDRLKEGGNVVMDLQETFWAKSYGSLTDKFGIEWQFNCSEVDSDF